MIMAVGGWNRMRINVSEAKERKKKVIIGFGLYIKSTKSPRKSVEAYSGM